MASIIDIGLKAKQLFRDHPPKNRDLYGWCQAFTAWCVVAATGTETGITWYDPADQANDASPKFTREVNDPAISVGDILYWHGITDGHVGVVTGRQNGRTLVMHTGTRHCDTVRDLGNSLRVSHADTMGYPFTGASKRNGTNPRIIADPWPAKPPTQIRRIPMDKLTFITTSINKNPFYFLDPFTGRKRFVPSQEWNALRAAEAAGGPKLVLVEVSKSVFDGIPG